MANLAGARPVMTAAFSSDVVPVRSIHFFIFFASPEASWFETRESALLTMRA
jgi:hypothetical protein